MKLEIINLKAELGDKEKELELVRNEFEEYKVESEMQKADAID